MSESFLSRVSHSHFTQNSDLTPVQSTMDGIVSTFVERTVDGYAFAGILCGGWGKSFFKYGTLRATQSLVPLAPKLLAPFSLAGAGVIGFGAEAALFEFAPRTLRVASGNADFSHLQWYGEGGLRSGLAHSAVSLIGFRLAAIAGAHQTSLAQLLLQTTTIVGANRVSALLEITDSSRNNLGEQCAEAQAMVLQIWAGLGTLHQLAPNLVQVGQGKELSIQARKISFDPNPWGKRSFGTPEILMSSVNGKDVSVSNTGVVASGPNAVAGSFLPSVKGASVTSPKLQTKINKAFKTIRTSKNRKTVYGAIDVLKNNRDAVREMLIGKDFSDFAPAQFDLIYRVLKPKGLEILTNPNIRRVLIPNRGEIALRVARGLLEEGIKPVITYSDSDANQSWVKRAREMGAELVSIGGQTAEESYLRKDHLIQVGKNAKKVDAVHPGYGFLSEDADFAEKIHEAGLVLMGPSVETMRRAGGKAVAKQAFRAAGVRVVSGTERAYENVEELLKEVEAKKLRYPIRLKAEQGGSGLGQGNANTPEEVRVKFPKISQESKKAFGSGALIAEEFVPRFQHIEFQIMADRFGNVIHLAERECTLQDGGAQQEGGAKLVEIHPAILFDRFPGLRERMQEQAVRAARAVNYTGHGTVEFMVNPDTGEFYALEVNARIQVEHRVTELVTGVDLVREQVRVSRGLPLSIRQSDIRPQGAAIEVRIKALTAGTIDTFTVAGMTEFQELEKKGIFIEHTYSAGDEVNRHYNVLIAKFIVKGQDRLDALNRMIEVLERTTIEGSRGFKSDLPQQLRLLRTETVREARYDNRTVRQWTKEGGENRNSFPYTEKNLFLAQVPIPIHFEVGSHKPIPGEKVPLIEKALGGLLRDDEKELQFQLTGPIADRLRTDADLRKSFFNGSEENSRKIWAQVEADGNLRRLIVIEGNQPRRVLLTHQAMLTYGEGSVPFFYDIVLSPGEENSATSKVSLYREGVEKPLEETFTMTGTNTSSPESQEYQFFSRSYQAALHLRLISTRSQTSLEVRDRDGNILLSHYPKEVIGDDSQRLLALWELSGQKGIPDRVREQAAQKADQIINNLAEMDPSSKPRQRAVEYLGSVHEPPIGKLVQMIDEMRSNAARRLLDEIMARRELQRREGVEQIYEFLSYEQVGEDIAVVRFNEKISEHETRPRLMIRHYNTNSLDYVGSLAKAIKFLKGLKGQYPEVQDNFIGIIAQRPSTEILSNEKVLVDFMLNSIHGALKGYSKKALDLKRVTFIVVEKGKDPISYTFRRKKNTQGERIGPFEEDKSYHNLHPLTAHDIELHRLKSFDLDPANVGSNPPVYLHFGRNRVANVIHLFANAPVYQATAQRYENGELRNIPEIEESLVNVMGAMKKSYKDLPVENRPILNRISIKVSKLDVTVRELYNYIGELVRRYREDIRGHDLDLHKLAFKVTLRDPMATDGFFTVLVRMTNPTGSSRDKIQLSYFVKALVREKEGEPFTEREVLVNSRVYKKWLFQPNVFLEPGEWSPAESRARPRTSEEIQKIREILEATRKLAEAEAQAERLEEYVKKQVQKNGQKP
jgi:acetyl-CoA carboxylase biotin carboxylase subunit